MSKINILPENLANKIAAGEVVERPASVVKELVENAIDAGSRQIFITLSEGGIREIAVQDDGEGMRRDDALLAFQRHATSKVASESDLAAIATLGFRGEALPSIASISKIRLVTRTASEPEGTELFLKGGQVVGVKAIGAPHGSLFEVKDLFYNTPARKKFLKSAQTELGHASETVFQLALSHPMIHFRFTHGRKTLFDSPAVTDLKDRILQLFGEEATAPLAEAHGEGTSGDGSLHVDAYFSRPPLKKNQRKEQYLFVNQRPVRSPLLSHAIYEAYGSYLMKGEHPFFILFLTIDPMAVDVNVHPTKREVRFQQSNRVHEMVRNIVRTPLSVSGFESPSVEESAVITHGKESGGIQGGGMKGGHAQGDHAWPRERSGHPQAATRWIGWPETVSEPIDSEEAPQAAAEGGVAYRSDAVSHPLIRPLGQIYGTFLLAEIDGEFVIVDQHTAHERVLYERFLEQWRGERIPAVQPLLIPQSVDLPVSKAGILRDHLGDLRMLGWEIEPFGETTFLIRETPALISKIAFETFLLDLTDDLVSLEVSAKGEAPIIQMIASMACHGAVRAHQPLTLPETSALLKDYFERKTPPTCPHGRPILLKYPLPEIEKLFRRR
ncbi:MAG: DNA mismatch repair endonuclease MutL [Candidatus Manganitrophaceae bacterium]